MNEYELLAKSGTIGIYNSCEVTEVVIMDDSFNAINLYTVAVFQEKPVTREKHKNNLPISKKIKINKEHHIRIFQYELELDEIKENFKILIDEFRWISNHKAESSITYPKLNRLHRQFIPSTDGNRLNKLLKNNFYSGSYVIEFFDEIKNFDLITSDNEKFEKLSKKIKKYVPLNLYETPDRLGNFIFQFPVNILNLNVTSTDSWDSIIFDFNCKLNNEEIPNCFLEAESILDKNYIGINIEKYDKTNSQELYVGNVDSLNNVKVWRESSKLLLYSSSEYFLKTFGLFMNMDFQNKRYFHLVEILF